MSSQQVSGAHGSLSSKTCSDYIYLRQSLFLFAALETIMHKQASLHASRQPEICLGGKRETFTIRRGNRRSTRQGAKRAGTACETTFKVAYSPSPRERSREIPPRISQHSPFRYNYMYFSRPKRIRYCQAPAAPGNYFCCKCSRSAANRLDLLYFLN